MKIGICFGGYCPMHQGHLDVIMRAKKENELCFVIVCGYDDEPRAELYSLPLWRRSQLIKEFLTDEQITVLEINDTFLGLDESLSEDNWAKWFDYANGLIQQQLRLKGVEMVNQYTWYVSEKSYETAITTIPKKRLMTGIVDPDKCSVVLMDKVNPVSGTLIRKNPIKYWSKIVAPFRPYFSSNILITGTASEGKSTLVKDIAKYFSLPYCEEYGRTYMAERGLKDTDLTFDDFKEFLKGQLEDITNKIKSPGNNGIVISDTDNIVTLMYAFAYASFPEMKITEEEYKVLEDIAMKMGKPQQWKKIFVLPPKNEFVDDGSRYMKQSSMEERTSNYNILCDLLWKFGWWPSTVEVLNGNYYENFNTVKNYINGLLSE